MARGRKPIPDELKKQKLTLTCKKENIEFLNTYCYTCGISISQLLDKLAVDLKAECEKREAKATRAAKKAAKAASVDENLPGQMNVSDFPQIMPSGDVEKMEQQLRALEELVRDPSLPNKDFEIHTAAIRDLKRAIVSAKEDKK